MSIPCSVFAGAGQEGSDFGSVETYREAEESK